jgi:hypothetical protein
MSELFENLSKASNGKELVDLINSLGLDAIAAELSGVEAAAIVEKFSADSDFNKFVGEVAANAAPVQAAPVPEASQVPVPDNALDFSRMVNAANGAELVGLFGNGDLATITAGLSPEQIEQVVQKFGADNDFNAWLTTVAPPPPPAEPVEFVPPPLPTGAELDELVDRAQNSGQGPLITDSKGQILNQYGEIMVLDSSGNLAPAPRDVPVGMLPDGDGSFMPDPGWMPPNPPPDYVPPGGEWIPPPGEEYFEPLEPPPEEGYFEPEGSDDNVEIVGQYSEPPLAHQNGA